jgi:hypothetical protein
MFARHEGGELLPAAAVLNLLRAYGSPVDSSITEMNLTQLPTIARDRELNIGIDNDAVG